jgi:hypothetical protein
MWRGGAVRVPTGSVRRKWWSSGSTLRYLNIELDQKRSMRSWRLSALLRTRRAASAYPVVDLAMPDGVVDAVAGACCGRKRLVADEEVQVLGATLARQMPAGASTAREE